MSPTLDSTVSETVTEELDDGVVANETMVIDPCPEFAGSGEMELKLEAGPDDPTEVVEKDSGPPDGGYGWVVVAYVPWRGVVGNGSAICVLNAFTWGINSVLTSARRGGD
jgi:hypothetical protein